MVEYDIRDGLRTKMNANNNPKEFKSGTGREKYSIVCDIGFLRLIPTAVNFHSGARGAGVITTPRYPPFLRTD